MTNTQLAVRKAKAFLDDCSSYYLAQKLGVTRQAVSKWESGRNLMDDEAVITLSHLLGEDTEALLTFIAADRAKTPAARKRWLALSQQLRAAAEKAGRAAIVIAPTAAITLLATHNGDAQYLLSFMYIM